MTEKDHSENVEVPKKKKKTKKPEVHEKAQVLDTMSGDQSLTIKIKEGKEQISDGTAHVKDGKTKKIKKRRIEKPEEVENEFNVPLKKKPKGSDDDDANQKKSKSNSDDTEMSEKKENKPKKKGSKKRHKRTKKTRRSGENRKILESLLEKTTEPKEELENITQEISDIDANEGDRDRDQEMPEETKEHLDADEKVEEREIVKKSKKRKKKEKNEEKDDDSEKPEQPPAKTQALAYLDLWKNNRNDWSFKKVRQIWLLKNLYNDTEVDDKKFKILLEYLSAAKGAARKSTIEEAQSIYAEVDKKNENEQDNSVKTNVDSSNCKLLRARQILQMLSE